MTDILQFNKPYSPSPEAAEHDLMCAEAECVAYSNMIGGYGATKPDMAYAERYKSARERVHMAREIMRDARCREMQKKTPVWQ